MNTNNNHTFRISILIVCSFIGAYVFSLILSNFFDIINLRTYDYLFQIRHKVYGKRSGGTLNFCRKCLIFIDKFRRSNNRGKTPVYQWRLRREIQRAILLGAVCVLWELSYELRILISSFPNPQSITCNI